MRKPTRHERNKQQPSAGTPIQVGVSLVKMEKGVLTLRVDTTGEVERFDNGKLVARAKYFGTIPRTNLRMAFLVYGPSPTHVERSHKRSTTSTRRIGRIRKTV